MIAPFALLLLASPPAPTLPPAPAAQDFEVRELDGGGELVVIEEPSAAVAAFRVAITGGALAEGDAPAGTARLFAAALEAELDELTDVAVQLEPEQVSLEFVGDAATLEAVLRAVAAPAFTDAQVEAARAVVASHFERGAAPLAADLAFHVHGFGARASQRAFPAPDDVAALDVDDLRAYHAGAVGRDRVHVGVLGHFPDDDALAARVAAALAALPAQAPTTALPVEPFLAPLSTRIVLVDVPDAERAHVRVGFPAPSRLEAREAVADVLMSLLTEPDGGRIRAALGDLADGADLVCEHDRGFRRAGHVSISFHVPVSRTGEAVDRVMGALAAARAVPSIVALSRAIEERERRDDALEADRASRLRRALALTCNGAPSDYWQKARGFRGALTPEGFANLATEQIEPTRFLVAVAAPAEEVVRDLDVIAPVIRTDRDLTPPSSEAGAALAQRMLDALGGAEAWRSVRALEISGAMTYELSEEHTLEFTLETQMDLDLLAFRRTRRMPGDTQIFALDGAHGWHRTASRIRSLGPTEYTELRMSHERRLERLARALAVGGVLGADVDDEGRLVLSSSEGELCRFEIGEDGRPTVQTWSLGEKRSTRAFDGWIDVEGAGVRLPASVSAPELSSVWTNAEAEALDAIDPDLTRDPRRSVGG